MIMSTLKEGLPRLPAAAPHPAGELARLLAAALLVTVSRALARAASGLVPVARPVSSLDPHFEFHAEAGAPEGALYVDGELVGWLRGVNRL
jgi:hypothetical protein